MEHRTPTEHRTPPTEHLTPTEAGARVYNGMPARELGSRGWRKPWSGPNGGNCVEALKLADGRVALRQSSDPDGPALIYSPHEIESFIAGAKNGEADFLLPTP